MAIPTFVDASISAYDVDGAASITPAPPTHQADDILLVGAMNAGGYAMSTVTSGWTKIAEINGTDDFIWYWKRATGAGTAGPTITASGTDQFGICYVIRGCITTGTPFEDATETNGADNNPDTSLITITGSDRLVVCSLLITDNTSWSVSPPPSGWTLDDDLDTRRGTDARYVLISIGKASSGDQAAIQIGTIGSAEYWGSLTLAFMPPSTASRRIFVT